MNKRKLSTVVLLFLPVLLLAGLAVSFRGEHGASLTVPNGKFKLVVSEIELKLLPSRHGESRVKITAYVTHEGDEPKWWRTGASDQWLQNLMFVDQKGKEYPHYSGGGGGAIYDPKRQSHVLQYISVVPKGYDVKKPGYFKGTVVMANQLAPLKPLGTARFSVPIQLG